MSAIPAPHLPMSQPSAWRRPLAAFVLLLGVLLVAYRDTALTMVGIWWRSETFAHAFLTVPISLWLIWRLRERLAATRPRPAPWMLLPLAALALAWLLADLAVVDVAAQFAFVGMVVLAVPVVLGFEVMGVILFPLLFLFFAVPFGEFVLPTMMHWTADFTVAALQASGVPVYREGQQFIVPNGSWSVIDECSGVRYLIASFMVGTLYAYLHYRSWPRRVVFMLTAIAVPIVANWLRAYLIVMVAYLSGNRIATGIDHVIYGWVFFGAIIFIMYAIGAYWSEPEDEADAPGTAPWRAGAHAGGSRGLHAALAGVLAVAALPHLAIAAIERSERGDGTPRLDLPQALALGWQAQAEDPVAWRPLFGHPSAEASRAYRGPDGSTVGVYLAYYRDQGPDRKLVSAQNMLIGMRDPEWNLMPGGRATVEAGPGTVGFNTAELLNRDALGASARRHLAVWRVYWVDGRFLAEDAAAKGLGALARLRGRGDEGASVVLYALGDSSQGASRMLAQFASANLGALDAVLRQTHGRR